MSFESFMMENEVQIRLGFFIGIFVIMACWELWAPKRALTVSKAVRWANNLGLVVVNTVVLRLLFPAAAIGFTAYAASAGWGLFNQVDLPVIAELLLAVIALDLVIYVQHVMFHAIPALWRLHRVHHADLDYDVTTGARFHPIEIVLSMGIKFAAIAVLGPSVVAVLMFEVILNAMSMFNHANVGLPAPLDRALRLFLVTPDMHRVHHSVEDDETNSNFGFSLSWWDRLLGTYRDQPRHGHTGMTIGIRGFRETSQVAWLPGLLTLPFKGRIGGYTINRRSWGDDDAQ